MDLTKLSTLQLLKKAKVPIITGSHFVYSGGRHGAVYINLRVLQKKENTEILNEVAYRLLVASIYQAKLDITKPILVVGPETLGAVLAKVAVKTYLKRHGKLLPIKYGSFVAYETGGEKKFKWAEDQNFEQCKGAKVVWFDDLITTGSTWDRTSHLVETFAPGSIEAVAVIVDRSGLKEDELNVKNFIFLEEISSESFLECECPLCAGEKPIVTNIGHGKKFQQEHSNYAGGFTEV